MKRNCEINGAVPNNQIIPKEILGYLFKRYIHASFVYTKCSQVCKTWNEAVNMRPLWQYKVVYWCDQLMYDKEAYAAICPQASLSIKNQWEEYIESKKKYAIEQAEAFLTPLQTEDPHSNDEAHPVCFKVIMNLMHTQTSNGVKNINVFISHITKIILRLFSLPDFEKNMSLARFVFLRFLPYLDADSISISIYTLNGLIYHSDKNILKAINYEPCNYIRIFRSLFNYCQTMLDITRVLFAVGLLAKRLRGNNQILFAKFFLENFMNNVNKHDFIEFVNHRRFDQYAKVIRDYVGTLCIFLALPTRDPSYSSFIKENLENLTSVIINLCYGQNQFIKAQAILAMFLLDNKRYSNKDFFKVKNDACWDLCSSEILRERFFESIRWLYFNAARSNEKLALRSIISQIINNKLYRLPFPKWIEDKILNRKPFTF